MRQFKFLGNPADYQWDFTLTTGIVYAGDKEPYHRHTITELYDIAVKFKDRDFLRDWEEINKV